MAESKNGHDDEFSAKLDRAVGAVKLWLPEVVETCGASVGDRAAAAAAASYNSRQAGGAAAADADAEMSWDAAATISVGGDAPERRPRPELRIDEAAAKASEDDSDACMMAWTPKRELSFSEISERFAKETDGAK